MVHNALAPVDTPSTIGEVPDDTWKSMMGIRAWVYLCATAAHPHLAVQRGHVDPHHVGCRRGGKPVPPRLRHGESGQRGLAKSLAQEWGPEGIRVNCIGPVAMTPAMERVADTSPVFTDGLLIGRTPLRRIGNSEADIGPVAVFLASDLSRYMTGQTLMVDGGGFTAF